MLYFDKTDGTPIPDNYQKQVVTFNPHPQIYNTLNLPSWHNVDYPFPNKGWSLSKSDANMRDCVVRNLWDYTYDTSTRHWAQVHTDNASQEYNSSKYNRGDLFYGQNALHWSNPERGAMRLYTDSTSGGRYFGAQVGDVKAVDHGNGQCNSAGSIPKARWMKGVSGLQFEWDMGIDDTDSNSDTNPSSYGYQLWDVNLLVTFMYPFGIDEWASKEGLSDSDFSHNYTPGNHAGHHMVPALTAYVPLFYNGKLHKDCLYWHERYSLWDPQELSHNEDVENFREQQGQDTQPPMRHGRCGFAVDSNHPMWNLLNHGMYIGKDADGDDHTTIFRHPEKNGANIYTAGAPLWSGYTIGFKTFDDHSNKRKNFRMWSVKPMTQPLTWTNEICKETTDGRLECSMVQHPADNSNHKPYSLVDPARVGMNYEPFGNEVAEKHGIGAKRISPRTELALPSVVDPSSSAPHKTSLHVYDSVNRIRFAPDAGTATSIYQPLVDAQALSGSRVSGGKGSGDGNSGGMPT